MIMAPLKPRRTVTKKRSPARAPLRTGIEHLPTDMLTEIVARVAAGSVADLLQCKQTCKALNKIGDEKCVLQQVDIESVYRSSEWRSSDKVQSFSDKCVQLNNSTALYRLGMVQYFGQLKMTEGLKNLESAAAQGLKEAVYALGLTLLHSNDNGRAKRGMELLASFLKVYGGKEIVECRRKLEELMYSLMWIQTCYFGNKGLSLEAYLMQKPKITCTKRGVHKIEGGWFYYDGKIEDGVVCEACKRSREADFFFKTLVNHVLLKDST